MMTDMKPVEGIPFLQQPYAFRVQEYAKVITAFVVAHTDLDPDVLTLPQAVDWFIRHDTNLQSESPATIAEVRLRVWRQLRVSRNAVLHLMRRSGIYTDAEAEGMADGLPEAGPASYIATRAGIVRWDNNTNSRGYYLEPE